MRRLSPSELYLPVLLTLLVSAALLGASSAAGAESATEPKGLATMRALALELLRVQDYDGSIEVYQEIAEKTPDDACSHYDLAAALSFVQRYEEAVPPIRAAIRIQPDDLKAQEMAALIYLKLKWYGQAFDATLKAAQLGEPTAMFSLVNMYERGLGVDADMDEAVYWAIKAAEHGHLGAMALMEDAYRSGRLGRQVDDAQADAWAGRLREAMSAQK